MNLRGSVALRLDVRSALRGELSMASAASAMASLPALLLMAPLLLLDGKGRDGSGPRADRGGPPGTAADAADAAPAAAAAAAALGLGGAAALAVDDADGLAAADDDAVGLALAAGVSMVGAPVGAAVAALLRPNIREMDEVRPTLATAAAGTADAGGGAAAAVAAAADAGGADAVTAATTAAISCATAGGTSGGKDVGGAPVLVVYAGRNRLAYDGGSSSTPRPDAAPASLPPGVLAAVLPDAGETGDVPSDAASVGAALAAITSGRTYALRLLPNSPDPPVFFFFFPSSAAAMVARRKRTHAHDQRARTRDSAAHSTLCGAHTIKREISHELCCLVRRAHTRSHAHTLTHAHAHTVSFLNSFPRARTRQTPCQTAAQAPNVPLAPLVLFFSLFFFSLIAT